MFILKLKLLVLKLRNVFKRKFSKNISAKAFLAPNVQIFGLDNIQIGDNCTIGQNTLLTVNNRTVKDKQLLIGANVYIGRDNFFSVGNMIQLNDYVIIGNKCSLICSDHAFSDPLKPYALSGNTYDKSIKIGANCWLGHEVSIIGNVLIGHGSIIGAKTVVLKNVPPFSMVVGNPAKIIKTYNFDSKRWEKAPLITNSKYLDEKLYLEELHKSGNIHLAYHSASYSFGDI